MSREKNKNAEKYPSSSIMLEISKEEHLREMQRSQALDNKSSVFIAGLIAVITIFMPLIPFEKIILVYKEDSKPIIVLTTIVLCALVSSIILFIKAFYKLFKAFNLKFYASINIENLCDEENLKEEADITNVELVKHYNKILSENISINDAKADSIAKGFEYSIFAFFILSLSAIFLQILTGV